MVEDRLLKILINAKQSHTKTYVTNRRNYIPRDADFRRSCPQAQSWERSPVPIVPLKNTCPFSCLHVYLEHGTRIVFRFAPIPPRILTWSICIQRSMRAGILKMIPDTNIIIYVCNSVGKDPVVKHSSFNCPGGENKVPLPTTVTRDKSRKLLERCRLKQVHPWLTSRIHFFVCST